MCESFKLCWIIYPHFIRGPKKLSRILNGLWARDNQLLSRQRQKIQKILESINAPIQWAPRDFSTEIRRPGPKVDRLISIWFQAQEWTELHLLIPCAPLWCHGANLTFSFTRPGFCGKLPNGLSWISNIIIQSLCYISHICRKVHRSHPYTSRSSLLLTIITFHLMP
jgi:hypothetical protein